MVVLLTTRGGYLGYEALCDGHRVSVALLKIMEKVPETNTVLQDISI